MHAEKAISNCNKREYGEPERKCSTYKKWKSYVHVKGTIYRTTDVYYKIGLGLNFAVDSACDVEYNSD